MSAWQRGWLAPCWAADETGAGADTGGQSLIARIEDLSRRIALAEIDLERYYMKYRILGSEEPKYRYMRYFLLQQAAAGLILGSQLTGVIEPGKHLRHPEDLSTSILRRASRAGLVSVILQGSSSAFELGSNTMLWGKHLIKRTDPGTARKEVASHLVAIDLLFMQRDKLMLEDGLHADAHALMAVEGKVLREFRNWCVWEFADVYADIRSYQSAANVYYLLDVSSASVYVASYALTLRGYKNPDYFGPSSIVGIVGDGLGIISAPTSMVSSKLFHKYWKKELAGKLHERLYDPEPQAKVEMEKLAKLLADSEARAAATPGDDGDPPAQIFESIKTCLTMYKLWSDRFDSYVDKSMIDLRHNKKVALQSAVSGPLISSAFLSQDIYSTYSAYRCTEKPRKQNGIFFATSVPTVVASGASLLLSSYWQLDSKLEQRRLKRQDALPDDLLQRRLATLDEIEKSIHDVKSSVQ